jgi:epsilon-lactone hydrolase
MPVIARRTGATISDAAKQRIAALKPYPTIDTWRNPLTRPIARRLMNDAWRKTLGEIDFDYRTTAFDIDGVACTQFETAASSPDAPLIFYIHGGGFVAGSSELTAGNLLPLCQLSGCEGLGVDYTLLPEAHYPVQIDEVDKAYRALVETAPARKIILLSESTGAAIALAALMRWRHDGVVSPAGAIFLSPCIDGKGASDSHTANDRSDPVIRSMGGKYVRQLFSFYAPDAKPDDPAVSPIYGRFEDMPPFMIHAGSRTVLLGDAARLSEAARQAGVDVRLRIFDGMFHRFHMHWSLEETRSAHADLAAFVKGV